MKLIKYNLKKLLTYSLFPILLLSCSTDENDLKINETLSSSSSAALTLSSSDVIALKSTGGYLSSDDTYLKCKGSSASDDGEKYQVVNHGGDVISLISLKTGKYVSSKFTRNTAMTANRNNAGAWEKFDIHYLGGDVIALSNTYAGSTKFMCSEGGRTDAAFSRTAVGGAWEKFTIEKISDPSSGGGSFIDTTDGTFQLNDFVIESSSDCGSSTDTKTYSFPYNRNYSSQYDCDDKNNQGLRGSEWYRLTSGDYYLKSASHDGKRTEWKEDDSSNLNDGSVMKYEASVTEIPENGVIIVQIHNRGGVSRPFLRVYIDNDRKIKVKVTTGNLTASSGSYASVLPGVSYVEGSKYKVQITRTGGKAYIKVETTSGTLEETHTPTSSWNSYSNDFYYKAGVYTEGDDTEPIMRFYSFQKS